MLQHPVSCGGQAITLEGNNRAQRSKPSPALPPNMGIQKLTETTAAPWDSLRYRRENLKLPLSLEAEMSACFWEAQNSPYILDPNLYAGHGGSVICREILQQFLHLNFSSLYESNVFITPSPTFSDALHCSFQMPFALYCCLNISIFFERG